MIDDKKQQVTILDENGTEITFSKLKNIQVKTFQKMKTRGYNCFVSTKVFK